MTNTDQGGGGYQVYETGHLTIAEGYKLFMGSVIPRPIAVVSSLGPDGKTNVAPFSNFMVISSQDGFVAFSVGNDDGESRFKDTLLNVQRTGEFVINLASASLASKVQLCSEPFPPDISEADEASLGLLPSLVVKTPRIAECKVHFECQLHSETPFGRTNLVVGKVVRVHVRSEIIFDHKIDPIAYAPLARIGGRRYCGLGDLIDV